MILKWVGGRGRLVILGSELMIWMQDTKVSEEVFRYFGILDIRVSYRSFSI